MIWIVLAVATIVVLIILNAFEYGKRLSLEHDVATLDAQLTASERARLQWEAHARRLRAGNASTGSEVVVTISADASGFTEAMEHVRRRTVRVLPGDPDSKRTGGAS